MIKNVLFAVHGVNTNQKRNWTHDFEEKFRADSSFDDWAFERGDWGFLFFLFSVSPLIRYMKIKQVQERLREFQRKYPEATIHVISHSYGTMLTHQAVKYSDIDTDKEPIKLGKFITIGGIIPERETFDDTLQEGQIKTIYNFCSYKDWVIHYQPIFGKCGYWGFLRPGSKEHYFKPYNTLSIFNFRFNVSHSEYFTEDTPNFYVIWKQLLLKKEK
jgi:hypothetical protein